MIDAHDAQLAPLDRELRTYARRQAGCRRRACAADAHPPSEHRDEGRVQDDGVLLLPLAVLVGVLIAGAVVDSADAGGYGARQVWLHATILTVGYMVSRGLAEVRPPRPARRRRQQPVAPTGLPSRRVSVCNGGGRFVTWPEPAAPRWWKASLAS
jgi:hypothetical protein